MTKRTQKLVGLVVAFAIPAVILFLVFSAATPVVSGSAVSSGAFGAWSSKIDDCGHQQPAKLGANFDFPLPEAQPWHLALDPRSAGNSELLLWKPGVEPAATLSKKSCASFSASYESDNAKINGKYGKKGEVAFDCEVDGGRLSGAFKFENCR